MASLPGLYIGQRRRKWPVYSCSMLLALVKMKMLVRFLLYRTLDSKLSFVLLFSDNLFLLLFGQRHLY